ncbi:MAG: hypothetical protein AAFW00_03980 [Bacteroidota bacterium]
MRKKSIQYNVDGIQYVPVKFVEGVRDRDLPYAGPQHRQGHHPRAQQPE